MPPQVSISTPQLSHPLTTTASPSHLHHHHILIIISSPSHPHHHILTTIIPHHHHILTSHPHHHHILTTITSSPLSYPHHHHILTTITHPHHHSSLTSHPRHHIPSPPLSLTHQTFARIIALPQNDIAVLQVTSKSCQLRKYIDCNRLVGSLSLFSLPFLPSPSLSQWPSLLPSPPLSSSFSFSLPLPSSCNLLMLFVHLF